jgi:hypothetical protein
MRGLADGEPGACAAEADLSIAGGKLEAARLAGPVHQAEAATRARACPRPRRAWPIWAIWTAARGAVEAAKTRSRRRGSP